MTSILPSSSSSFTFPITRPLANYRGTFLSFFNSFFVLFCIIVTFLPVVAMSNIILRKSAERGYADHGWLKSFHSFSFAGYYDPKFQGYGPLRVINEDTVAGGNGFPTHGHANFEIFSYILSGGLLHKDSIGNKEVLTRGEIQFTTAGTGIEHSEFNADSTTDVRFLQIWVKPNKNGLKPSYQTKKFDDSIKLNTLCPLISPGSGSGSNGSDTDTNTIKINQDFNMYASLLEQGKSVTHVFNNNTTATTTTTSGNRRGYLHVPIMPNSAGLVLSGIRAVDGLSVDPVTLAPGDAAFLEGLKQVTIEGRGRGGGKGSSTVATVAADATTTTTTSTSTTTGLSVTEFVLMEFGA